MVVLLFSVGLVVPLCLLPLTAFGAETGDEDVLLGDSVVPVGTDTVEKVLFPSSSMSEGVVIVFSELILVITSTLVLEVSSFTAAVSFDLSVSVSFPVGFCSVPGYII